MNYWRILFLSLFVVACSNSESNRSSEEPPSDGGEDVVGANTEPEIVEMEGMIHIENGSVTIGSDDKIFKANERPAMKVKLDYDFFMDIIKTIGRCYRGGPFMPSGFSDHYLLSFYRNGELIYWNHNLDRYFSGSDKDDTQSD